MTNLISGDLGPEGKYELGVAKGVLSGKVEYTGSQLKAGANGDLDLNALIEKTKEKVTNKLLLMAINLVQAMLNSEPK